ncbi:hypothetical protein [Microbacterium aurantiacum]|uniref:Uncharacterized protein n=1 Tax=Microbacterium aurantiacum TaxID=162393 RepID=A0A0N0RRB6_9MICO|nr:hypothetical protein [Microbacterium chocolatum]ANG85769.1 hypothetical protein A8L33_10540 [Microbacterium chocolatum]KOS10079.1 hypothetical protein XI38_12555 [Microbacterium chocolatum]
MARNDWFPGDAFIIDPDAVETDAQRLAQIILDGIPGRMGTIVTELLTETRSPGLVHMITACAAVIVTDSVYAGLLDRDVDEAKRTMMNLTAFTAHASDYLRRVDEWNLDGTNWRGEPRP